MEEEKKVGKTLLQEFCKQFVSHSDKSRWIAEVEESINNQQTPFSESSKEMIHASRNVEDFELAMSIVRKNLLLSFYEKFNEELFAVIAVFTQFLQNTRSETEKNDLMF